jgi:hypothetical protein
LAALAACVPIWEAIDPKDVDAAKLRYRDVLSKRDDSFTRVNELTLKVESLENAMKREPDQVPGAIELVSNPAIGQLEKELQKILAQKTRLCGSAKSKAQSSAQCKKLLTTQHSVMALIEKAPPKIAGNERWENNTVREMVRAQLINAQSDLKVSQVTRAESEQDVTNAEQTLNELTERGRVLRLCQYHAHDDRSLPKLDEAPGDEH